MINYWAIYRNRQSMAMLEPRRRCSETLRPRIESGNVRDRVVCQYIAGQVRYFLTRSTSWRRAPMSTIGSFLSRAGLTRPVTAWFQPR